MTSVLSDNELQDFETRVEEAVEALENASSLLNELEDAQNEVSSERERLEEVESSLSDMYSNLDRALTRLRRGY